MNRKPPASNEEFLHHLSDAFDAVPPEGPVEAADELRAWGLDPAAVGKQLGEFARKALQTSPFNWRVRAARERERALANLHTMASVKKPRPELEADIQAILSRGSQKAQQEIRAYFHNHQGRASDSDLESLLAQVRFLESLEEEAK